MIVLFDGVCNLCNATVNFIIDRDPKGVFRFAALQSGAGRRLAGALDSESIVLVDPDRGRTYVRSTAALRIAAGLRWPWPVLAAFLAIPRFLRDAVYDLIARRRYRWFGKLETCRLPEPGVKERFIE